MKTKWYLLLLALALLIFCVIFVWFYMGVQVSQPSNAELVLGCDHLERSNRLL
ncbi:MAG: hypothetical protein LUD12_01550 [Lachnospiraceae bacterium]|nr:hypothetical protein [Lachnospiraceae bacterium]